MTRKIILLANDATPVRLRFGQALEKSGHRVVSARRSSEVLAALGQPTERPDLILLDLHLPGSLGVDLVQAIRAAESRRTPVVIFAGTVETADEVKRLAEYEIAGYISESCVQEQIVPTLAPHLFPDNFNRRSSARVSLGIPVAFRHDESITAALTLDLGKGGIAVRTMAPLDTSDKVVTRFRLPGSERDIEAESHVAWSDRRVGMGLQFEHVAPAHQTAIDEFIDRHVATQSVQ